MQRIFLLFTFLFCVSHSIVCQNANSFPQEKVNVLLQKGFEKHKNSNAAIPANSPNTNSDHLIPILNTMDQAKKNPGNPTRIHNNFPQPLILDTLIVGASTNDTLVITGNWTHTGPIWIFNSGVLIFKNATVIDTGDVYVFGNGKWIADSSSFFFPQTYFYQRSFLVLQNASAHFGNCSMNYSGMSHSLLVADGGIVDWQNMHENDWTTCGLYGHATINIHGCNQSGEYIMSDSCTANFVHADTLILWHHLPQTALINYSFPSGNPVYNYTFNNTVLGVSGINYQVHADSCNDVMWALMPANGSDVTISNSTIRLIGAWFERGDTTSAYGVFNNSNYTNFTAPLADRNLHLINTSVQTWSFYVFDSSQVSIDSCQLGEIGTQQRANVIANQTLADGTGGYFWATDSSFTFATNSISYNTCRSEKKGFFILSYSWMPFVAPTAINNSNLVCVQNNLVADPVPYDGSVAWLLNIEGPDTASINSTFPVNGSAWINQGPQGNPVDFASYSLYYQYPAVSSTWYPIVVDSAIEISHNALADWNTYGLIPGTYILMGVLKSNFNDSVEGLRLIQLLPNALSVHEIDLQNTTAIYPNPFSNETFLTSNEELNNATMVIYNSVGEKVRTANDVFGKQIRIGRGDLSEGIYFVELFQEGNLVARNKMVVGQ